MDREDVIDLLSLVSASDNRTVGEMDVILWHRLLGKYAKDECLDAIMAHRKEHPGVWLEPGHIVQRVIAIRRDCYERADPDTRDNPWRELGGQPSPGATPLPDGGFIDANGVRRDRHGYIDKTAPDDDYPDDTTTEQRLDAYWAKIAKLRDNQEQHQAVEHFGSLAKTPPANDETRRKAMTEIRRILAERKTNTQRPFAYLDNSPTNPLLAKCPHCGAEPGIKCKIPGTRDILKQSRAHPSRFEAAEKQAANT